MWKGRLVKISRQALFITVMGGFIIFVSQCYPDFINSITLAISDHAIFFRVIRWGVIICLAFSWRYFVRKIGLPNEKTVYWQSKIILIVAWLILFELLICENIILEFIHYF